MKNEIYPVQVSVALPEKPSRLLAFLTLLFLVPKMIILVPHHIILYFLGIASLVAAISAQFVVLFTGKYPQALFDFVLGATRWQVRVNAFLVGLTDKYPPFRLD